MKSTMELIDDYGKLSIEIQKLTKQRESIKDEIKKLELESNTTHHGIKYDLELREVSRIELDPKKVRKVTGDKVFMEIAHVTVEAAKQVLTLTQIDRCIADITSYVKFSVKEKKGE